MTHLPGHIICGTGGTPVTDKTIVVYDAPFSVAIKIDANVLEEQSVASGMSREKVQKRLTRFVARVERDWEDWAEYLEDKLCIGYTRHDPHPDNFDP